MKEKLIATPELLLKFVKKIPGLFRKLLGLKIYFGVVLVLVVVSFLIGSNFNQSRITAAKVEKSSLSFSQDFEDIKIAATEAQLASTIRVSQKAAPAPAGKKYLVLFTTIESASSSAKQINYGDYFRLEQDNKKLAPLPVNINFVIPAKSSLDKQLIFIIDEGKKAFNLLVGPIDKEPQTIKIAF